MIVAWTRRRIVIHSRTQHHHDAIRARDLLRGRTTSPVARVAPETRVPVHDVHRGAQEASK
jgi:hypothetical protein